MGKHTFLLLAAAILASVNSLNAAPISQSRAKSAAENFFGTGTKAPGTVKLVWDGSDGGTKSGISSRPAPFYVYNRDGGGFVVISGDDDTQAVLAYSMDNSFSATGMPENLKRVMSRYSAWIEGIRKGKFQPVSASRASWETGTVGTKSGSARAVVDYGTALWGQSDPYNGDCPLSGREKTVSGCVATAMAIIMRHHKYPDCGYGGSLKEYKTETLKLTVPSRQLSNYDWDNMPLEFTSSATTLQKNAVSKLMADCGAAIEADYNLEDEGTAAYTEDAVFALCDIFKYDRGIRYVLKAYYTYGEWLSLIKKELDENGPVMYDGSDYKGESGHEFVVDGYDSNDYLKFNFGWEGGGNGFYYMTDTELSFNEGAVIGISPDNSWTSEKIPVLAIEYGTFEELDKLYCGIESSVPYVKKSQAFTLSIHFANVGNTEFRSTVSARLLSSDGTLKQELLRYDMSSAPLAPYYRTLVTKDVTITKDIEEGDCIQAFYYTSKGWQPMGDGTKSTLTLRYDIATEIGLTYNKGTGMIIIAGRPGMSWTFNGKSGKMTYACADALDIPSVSGEYPLTISNGNTSYTVKLKF